MEGADRGDADSLCPVQLDSALEDETEGGPELPSLDVVELAEHRASGAVAVRIVAADAAKVARLVEVLGV